MAETLKDEHAKVAAGFQNVANAHVPPSQPAATGQTLTSTLIDSTALAVLMRSLEYHGSFYEILSVRFSHNKGR